MRLRLSFMAVGCLLALAACEGGGPQGALPDLPGSTAENASSTGGGAPTTGAPTSNDDARCAPLAALPQMNGDVVGWLNSIPIAPSGSEGFKEPSPAQLQAFQSAFEELLGAGPTGNVQSAFASLNFELLSFRHDGGGRFVVLQEKEPRTGAGTYVVNVQPARDLWLEAPHADSDAGTLKQAASQLVELGARALLITGANRCANAQATTCDGKSVMCGGQLRVSDAAHYDATYFTAAHRALRRHSPQGVAASIHGMDTQGAEAAVISDGTMLPNPSSRSLALRDALNKHLGASSSTKAFSCNDPADDGKFRPLCGTTNVQGRIDNASAQACTAAPSASRDTFLHVEQGPTLRSAGPRDATTLALGDVVPCSLGGPGLACPTVAPVCQ